MPTEKQNPVLDALWESVVQRWDEASVHESLLLACSEENDLAFAAMRYRRIKDDGPTEQREFAEAQLEKITGLAYAQITSMKRPRKDHRRVVTIIAALVSVFLAGACIYMISL